MRRCLAARYGFWPNEYQYLNLVFRAKDQVTPIQDSSSSLLVLIPPVSCLQWRKTDRNRCQLRHLLLNQSSDGWSASFKSTRWLYDCWANCTAWFTKGPQIRGTVWAVIWTPELWFNTLTQNLTMPHSLKSSFSFDEQFLFSLREQIQFFFHSFGNVAPLASPVK